ncbi:NAD(P)H-binding protein [Bailinhaonella thermotolerans]|uniref:NAD(P)H-binding protein n=1 Tax=Bailinhaonella thermotolerans TaxID=1070861 RepID=UPI001F5B7855|nr:NAD(P)H-binding protein [Bailinhaonella thermotolerans]
MTGATGNVGRLVADRLRAAGVAVRALVRDPARAGLPEGVEVAEGDLTRPDTVAGALAGVDSVFLVWPFLSTEGAAEVLRALDGRRVVYLSSSGVDDAAARQGDPINRLHADMEALVRASGSPWTALRADTIASNTLGWAGQIRATGTVSGPDIAPTAVIDPRDIAEVAARVLTGPGHEGATYVLTGPEVVSRADQVRAIGEAIGRPLRFEAVPAEVARERMLADGRPPALVDALLAGAESRTPSTLITTTVRDLTGSPARPFRQWAADHADRFR